MTNRDENLKKKINAELEQLSDEQLDEVAGGTIGQTSDDSKFLYEHGIINDRHGNLSMMIHWKSYSKEVDDGRAKAGITCFTKPGTSRDNLYFINGQPISRTEAYNIVEKNSLRSAKLKIQFRLSKKVPSIIRWDFFIFTDKNLRCKKIFLFGAYKELN